MQRQRHGEAIAQSSAGHVPVVVPSKLCPPISHICDDQHITSTYPSASGGPDGFYYASASSARGLHILMNEAVGPAGRPSPDWHGMPQTALVGRPWNPRKYILCRMMQLHPTIGSINAPMEVRPRQVPEPLHGAVIAQVCGH